MDVTGKKVIVVGLARSGVGAANLLYRFGAQVTVTDKKKPEALQASLSQLQSGISCVLGGHPPELFETADLIVLSPGVPLSLPFLKAASERGVRIIGELELAYEALSGHKTAFLAITGTNGKSTTASLLAAIMKRGGRSTLLGGNIGFALTDILANALTGPAPLPQKIFDFPGTPAPYPSPAPDCIVAEVSSFQLETVRAFRPKGAAILNITPDHMDRYPSMAAYIDAKCRIFMNQDRHDFLVLNADDPVTEEIEKLIGRRTLSERRPALFYFSRKKEIEGAWYKNGAIHFRLPVTSSPTLYPSSFKIKGVHNIENAMAASVMALLSGCDPGAVADTLADFPGLEHRLEFVREMNGITFVNDSKGTNVGAVVKSLESFEGPVILIAGGRDKDGDFSGLKPLVRDKVKALVLIGEARDKIKKTIGGSTTAVVEESLAAAVIKARALAAPGDVVLLSPACASFDMFRDFEDRGRQFKEAVRNLS